jgi:hypothetical protein
MKNRRGVPCNHNAPPLAAMPASFSAGQRRRDDVIEHLAELVKAQRETNHLLRLILAPILSIERSCRGMALHMELMYRHALRFILEEERKALESWSAGMVHLIDLFSASSCLIAAAVNTYQYTPFELCIHRQLSLFWLARTATRSISCFLVISLRLSLGFIFIACLWLSALRPLRVRDPRLLSSSLPPSKALSSLDAARVVLIRPFVVIQIVVCTLLLGGHVVYQLLGRLSLLPLILQSPSQPAPRLMVTVIAISLLAGSIGFRVVYQAVNQVILTLGFMVVLWASLRAKQ